MLALGENKTVAAMCIVALLTQDLLYVDPQTGILDLEDNELPNNRGGVAMDLDFRSDMKGEEEESKHGIDLRNEYRNTEKTLKDLAGIRRHLNMLSELPDYQDMVRPVYLALERLEGFFGELPRQIKAETVFSPAEAKRLSEKCLLFTLGFFKAILPLLKAIEPKCEMAVRKAVPGHLIEAA